MGGHRERRQRSLCARPIVVIDSADLVTGSSSRSRGVKCMQPIAADVLDFKTDAIADQDQHALSEKVGLYRPQLQTHCEAVRKITGAELQQISAKLVLLEAGLVVPIPSGGVG